MSTRRSIGSSREAPDPKRARGAAAPVARKIRNGGVHEDSAIPALACYLRTKVVRTATASERPSVGRGHTRGDEPACLPVWHSSQYEVLTNDDPRHQPARPETRPNQRLCVPLGSPPSVAVDSSSARAAHLSRAPQIDIRRMTLIAPQVKILRDADNNHWMDLNGPDACLRPLMVVEYKRNKNNGHTTERPHPKEIIR
jgi:hypothetical protein